MKLTTQQMTGVTLNSMTDINSTYIAGIMPYCLLSLGFVFLCTYAFIRYKIYKLKKKRKK
jgi:TRAP-type C4-dicarboxylate transport system permease large subunit